MLNRNIVVVGGSAGALTTLTGLLDQLPDTLPAAIFVVLHRHPTGDSWLREVLARHTRWPVKAPTEEPVAQQRIYVAQPDLHLILKDDVVVSSRGPRENQWRPAIDVLFRSAAVAYTSRVVGVLLSGELDDGTAGLAAIKHCGGITIAQDPATTTYSTMPEVAAANVRIDHFAAPGDLGPLLERVVASEAPVVSEPPESMRAEVRISEGTHRLTTQQITNEPASTFSCPECGGPLWTRGQEATNFRCLIGHAFGMESLVASSDASLDRTLWAAIRQFEQRANIARLMAQQSRDRQHKLRASMHDSRAEESEEHAQRLRELQARYRYLSAANDDR